MKTTAFRFGVLLAAVVFLALWAGPAQGEGATDPPGAGGLNPSQSTRTCDYPSVLRGSLPYNLGGGTQGRGDNYDLGGPGTCSGGGTSWPNTGDGEDEVFVFRTDIDCTIGVTMTPQDAAVDLALYVLSPDCGNVAGNCVYANDIGGPGDPEEIELPASADQYYFVIVDGYGGHSGNFDLVLDSADGCQFADWYSEIGDTVWLDTDQDGIQDQGEDDLNQGLVNLHKCGGPFLSGLDLDIGGDYGFGGLLPGDYFVEVVLPAGYAFSPQDQGGNDALDSDADPLTGRTPCFSTQAGIDDRTWDVGAHPETFEIGDLVWYDTDRDGIQDPGEPGLAGAGLQLRSGDCNGPLLTAIVSDGAGWYFFSPLAAGTYCVSVNNAPATPGPWVISPKDRGGDDTVDSDFDPVFAETGPFALSAHNQNVDLGMYSPGTIGGTVWCDGNDNQSLDPGEEVGGVLMTLYSDPECDQVKNSVLRSYDNRSDGIYAFHDLQTGPPGGVPVCYVVEPRASDMGACSDPLTSPWEAIALTATIPVVEGVDFGFWEPDVAAIGDRVWYDTDQDGIQDGGEPGLPDVTLHLHDNATCQGSPFATDVTDSSGFYGIGGIDLGIYCLDLKDGVPFGWAVSPADQGADDSADSDINPNTWKLESINLQGSDGTVDAGMFMYGVIGGTVWCDRDADGSLDQGEGVGAVTVRLQNDTDCNSLPDGLRTSQDTGAGGSYNFYSLHTGPPGGTPVCYVVTVDVGDMGTCDLALDPNDLAVGLTADAADSWNNNIGFVELLHPPTWIYVPLVLR